MFLLQTHIMGKLHMIEHSNLVRLNDAEKFTGSYI